MENNYEEWTNGQRPIMNDLEDVFNEFLGEELAKLDDHYIRIDYDEENTMSDEEYTEYEQRVDIINDEIERQKDKLFTEFAKQFYYGTRQVVLDIQNQLPGRMKEIVEEVNQKYQG